MISRHPVRMLFPLFLVLLAEGVLGQVQAIGFERISLEQGLSQGMVHDVVQDQDGFLWIATKDGLNRYDGYDFKIFTHDPYDPTTISANNLSCLFEDSRGRLWVGTENRGLNLYMRTSGRFVRIQHQSGDVPGLSGNRISRIGEDADGHILVAVLGGGLNVLTVSDAFPADPAGLAIQQVALPGNPDILGIALDGKGRSWLGTWQKIFAFDPESHVCKLVHEGLGFESYCLDSDGHLWLGREEAKPRWFDGERLLSLSDFPLRTRGMRIDHQGRLWIALADGLYMLDLNKEHPARGTYKPAVRRRLVESLLGSLEIDRSGQLWAGTRGFGLIKINPNKPVFHHQGEGSSFSHIIPDPSGTLIRHVFGRNRWTVVREGTMDTVPLGNLFEGMSPAHLLITRSGDYWGRFYYKNDAHTSLMVFDPATGRHHSLRLDGAFDETQPALEDRFGNVWMAGVDGLLVRIDPGTYHVDYYNFHPTAAIRSSGLPSTSLYEDHQGRLWIGSQGGFAIATFQGPRNTDPQFVSFANDPTNRNSLNCDYVSAFLEDPANPDRHMWIATKGGGLNRFDLETSAFVHFNMDYGLPNNVIYGLLPDEAGNIWGSSNKGIFCMSPQGTEYMIRSFSPADGLQADEFNSNSFLSLPDGRLLFGGVNGLNIFRPEDVLTEDFQPNVFITKILVNSREVHPDSADAVLANTIETTRAITLTADQDILTFEFAALDFTSPRHNQYRYQLIGADDEWVDAKTRRTATYLHLRPGHYTFRVQGTNSRGIWSPHMAEITIRVLPPWWRTWWAYAAYALVFGLGLRYAFRFYLNRGHLHSRLAFETREAERVKELDAAKTQLYTNITHEFRTPLTIILGMARQAQQQANDAVKDSLEMIVRNGQNLLRLVNDMLDLSKLDSGKLSLQPVRGNVVEFLRYVFESYYSLGASRQVQLHFLSEVDSLVFVYDQEKLRQIISNLLSNAIKFTPEGGQVYFSIGSRITPGKPEPDLVIRVKDTGIGIPESKLPYVFDRFFQAGEGGTTRNEGSGIGLALTRELIRLMEGEVVVRSPAPGSASGTEFTVILPALSYSQSVDVAWQEEIPEPVAALSPQGASPVAHIHGARPDDEDGPQLLLVEDNPDVVAYIAGCLAGHSLQVARDGLEGLEMARANVPDLVISDVMMPRMDGFTFCRELRADERTSHIPVILLTARADIDSKLEGLDTGADAYLEKPFYPEELRLRIRKLLEMREKLQHYYLNAAGLQEISSAEGPSVVAPAIEDAFIRRAREVVEQFLTDEQFNVERFCREMCLSHSQLHRKLSALTGMSANQFIRSLRLKKARELLLQPEIPIATVAFDSGFQDPAYFSRVFKQVYGVTPNEWRLQATIDGKAAQGA